MKLLQLHAPITAVDRASEQRFSFSNFHIRSIRMSIKKILDREQERVNVLLRCDCQIQKITDRSARIIWQSRHSLASRGPWTPICGNLFAAHTAQSKLASNEIDHSQWLSDLIVANRDGSICGHAALLRLEEMDQSEL